AHAEDAGGAAASQALLDGLRWVEERHDGQKSWWLSYPVDQHRQFRNLPESSRRSTQTAHYRGRHVRIQSGGNGPLLYVDLRIEVRAGARLGGYNRGGPARAQGGGARLRLGTGSGEVHVRDHVGGFTGDTGSGSIDAAALRGTVSLDTGSGNV